MDGNRSDKEDDVDLVLEAVVDVDLVLATGDGEKWRKDSFIRCREDRASGEESNPYGAFLSLFVVDGGIALCAVLSPSGVRDGLRGAAVAVGL